MSLSGGGESEGWRVKGPGDREIRGKRVSVVMVPDAPLLIKDGWLTGWMDGWVGGGGWSRDAILICAIIMCTHSPEGWCGGGGRRDCCAGHPWLLRPAFLCLPPESEGNRVIEELIRTRPVL